MCLESVSGHVLAQSGTVISFRTLLRRIEGGKLRIRWHEASTPSHTKVTIHVTTLPRMIEDDASQARRVE